MSAFLRRQLTDYVEYHRDPMNCALHVVGIVILFLGAVLPLSLLPVTVFGFQVNLGILLAIPVLVYWILLDFPIGLAIAGAAALLLLTAATIANHASVTVVWAISIVLLLIGVALQIIGHQVFERRQPALMDNPTHLLLGPVFVMAKLFISLGFRRDLAAIIQQGSNSVYQSQGGVQQDRCRAFLSRAAAASLASTWWQRLSRAAGKRAFSMYALRAAPWQMRSTSKVQCSTANWWIRRSTGSTRCTILPAFLACGWRVKTTFMP